jgi:hypothetical protein
MSNYLYFMTRTSELRQGNYVLQSHLETVNVVLGTKPKYILTDCKVADGDWIGSALYEPIPLTEDWLVKFGLETSQYYSGHRVRYKLPDERFEIDLEEDGEHGISFEGNILTYINYVHQLQNIYFTLTGEELNLSL